MPKQTLEFAAIQEFPPEMAGELVGWLNIVEHSETEIIGAAVAYARIGAQGAKCGYTVLVDNQEQHFAPSNYGFEYSTELAVFARDGNLVDTRASRQTREDGRFKLSDDEARNGGFANSFYPGDGDPRKDGTWATGTIGITEMLKTELNRADVGWMYPTMYYYLSQMCRTDIQLVDPTMHETTAEQFEQALQHRAVLQAILEADTAMTKDLTIFGGVSADEIPEHFQKSRRTVAEYERELAAQRGTSYVHGWQMPIGARPSGRSWPYMDPTTADESRAFGQELAALQNRNVSPALHELGREMKELNMRLETAQIVLRRLGSLSTKELNLLSL